VPEVIRANPKRAFIVFAAVTGCTLSLLFLYKTMWTSFFIGLFLTYVLLPFVDKLDARLPLARYHSVLMVIHAVILIIGGVIAGLVPVLRNEVVSIVKMLPRAREYFIEIWLPNLKDFVVRFRIADEKTFGELVSEFQLASTFGG